MPSTPILAACLASSTEWAVALVPTPAMTVRPVSDRVLDRLQDLAVLVDRRGRRLAGRAADDDAVVAVVDQVDRDARRCVEVDLPSSSNAVAIAVRRRPNGAAPSCAWGDVMEIRLSLRVRWSRHTPCHDVRRRARRPGPRAARG